MSKMRILPIFVLSGVTISAAQSVTSVPVTPEQNTPQTSEAANGSAASGSPGSAAGTAMPIGSSGLGVVPAGPVVLKPTANGGAAVSKGIEPQPAVAAPKAAARSAAPVSTAVPVRVRPSSSRSRLRVPREGKAPSSRFEVDAALTKTAQAITEARLMESIGDDYSLSGALDRAFDAVATRPNVKAHVAGRAQDVRGLVKQKVLIANTASPADAPELYEDALKTAKDKLPAASAQSVAQVILRFAARKADISLDDLASAAYAAAAQGSVAQTRRLLAAFDKWESLLGFPGRPLISNAVALKGSISDLLKGATAGKVRSAPHVWFTKKDGVYSVILPGTGVAVVPSTVASVLEIAPLALSQRSALGDAYRAFLSDPRASVGATLVFRAHRALGGSVPSAAIAAVRFWLASIFESMWRWIVRLFAGARSYDLSQSAGQDALRRDAVLAGMVRAEAVSARRIISSARLTVGGVRAAFAAARRSAEADRSLTSEGDPLSAIQKLSDSFNDAARTSSSSDPLTAGLSEFITGPGALVHWLQRLETGSALALDERFLGSRGGVSSLRLGQHEWVRQSGANGEVRLSAELRSTGDGGSIDIRVERGNPSLSRHLEDLGLTVFSDGGELHATIGPEDFSHDAAEMGLLASRAMAAALGHDEDVAVGAELKSLVGEVSRHPDASARLAARLDAREAFARAPVIGRVGSYEALVPTVVTVAGKPSLVSALRDPDTGLIVYARAK